VRVHRQTQARPIDRHAEERPHLVPLPARPFDAAEVVYRTVDNEGFVVHRQNFYATPWRLIGQTVAVRVTEDELVIHVVIAVVRLRQALGLGWGRTVALDDWNLVLYRYGLAGRPDRLIRQGDMIIPEEWKSASRVWRSHRAQMGVYFLLIEDQLGVRPSWRAGLGLGSLRSNRDRESLAGSRRDPFRTRWDSRGAPTRPDAARTRPWRFAPPAAALPTAAPSAAIAPPGG
jgi:hypothetical protein